VFAEPTGGTPLSRPEDELNVAQAGRLLMLKVSGLPSGSLALGKKLYGWSSTTVVGGVPPMVGGEFVAVTVIEKAGREAESCPSLAEMTMPPYVPAFDAEGAPLRVPVALSKLAHDGRPAIEKESLEPSGSLADGLKL
jgi:hypothetical protein